MATIVDSTACVAAGQGAEDGLLPVNPFTALQFHFGMLLGVDDLDTGQGYPRGKMRLHNAWLHRDGVVWGFDVRFNARAELTVEPGLGLDAAGHEVHLDRSACVDLGAWYAANRDDPAFGFETNEDGSIRFSVHVVARFKACLTRPVPAMLEPCAGSQTDTAFSRVFETVELLLRPGLAPSAEPGYHRLRQLFRIEPDDVAAYPAVAPRRSAIQGLPADQQPAAWLAALREFAALDARDLAPQAATGNLAGSIFPQDPADLVLADLADVRVVANAAGDWKLAEPLPTPAITVRQALIPTAAIQELLCGPLSGAATAAPTGPVVTAATLDAGAQMLTLVTSRPLDAATVAPDGFVVSEYRGGTGWHALDIAAAGVAGDGSVVVKLATASSGTGLRLIARGTGPAPLLAAGDHLPLGAPGAGGADDGIDFVKMFWGT